MAKPKIAKLLPITFDTRCPHCDGDLHAPSGSVQWQIWELEGQTIECVDCHKPVTMPRPRKTQWNQRT